MGSGATGMAAAITAAENGAKVAIYEKQRSIGGTSNFFNGTFAVESKMQRENFVMYSKDEAFKAVMEYSHWRANARLVRAVVNESAATIHWLLDQGVEFYGVIATMPYAQRTYHHIKGGGAALIKVLADRAKEKGIQLKLGVPVTGLLKDGNSICGVTVEENDEEIEVTAKAVIIASGGYANNKEWIKKYNGYDLGVNIFPVGSVDKTGDGIRMASEAGAALEGLDALEMFAVAPQGPEFDMMNDLEIACLQPNLWVDPKGRRYVDEGIAFYDTSVGNANARYKYGPTFRILDDHQIDRLAKYGIDKDPSSKVPPGSRLLNIRKVINAALEYGSKEVFAAESIRELAEQIGVDAGILEATVTEYNHYCEKGYDSLFAKDPKYLVPLKGPRYYAVKCYTIFLGTKGGLRINENMEVVDKKDTVIQGLFAGGLDTGGMYGDSYPIIPSTGLSSGYALNSGRIAGRNAAKFLIG